MKKLTPNYKDLMRLRTRRSEVTRERRRVYLLWKRCGIRASVRPRDSSSATEEFKKVAVPEVLSLEHNPEETLKFLDFASRQIKRNRRSRRKRTKKVSSYFDFTKVREICPATALILCSIYDVLQMRGRPFKVFEYDDWSASVKSTFAKIGFFKWLEFKGITDSYDYHSELPIEAFKSDTTQKAEIPITYLQKLVEAFNASRLDSSCTTIGQDTSRRVASAILEATENSVRHAYHAGIPKDIRRRWWVGGLSNPKSGEVLVACYDCGISIPGSIAASKLDDEHGVRNHVRKVITRFLNTSNRLEDENSLDHKRLDIALRYLLSTSGSEGGGKGLTHIASTIDDCENGKVDIFSRRAHFSATKGRRATTRLLPSAMPGTLIVWRVKLYSPV